MERQGWQDARLADALLDMGARKKGPPMPLFDQPPRKKRRLDVLEPMVETPLRDTTLTYTAEIAGGAPFVNGNITKLATKMSDRQRKHTGARPQGSALGGEERPPAKLRTAVPLVKRMATLKDIDVSPMESAGVAGDIVTEHGITRFRASKVATTTATVLRKNGVSATTEELQ